MSEHTEQAAVIQWAMMNEGQYPELRLLHASLNGAKLPYKRNQKGGRYSSEASKLIDEGLKSGVPDLSLPVARGGYFGLYIEMKVKPNKPTPAQLDFINLLNEQGYRAVVCYGSDEAIGTLIDYLNMWPTVRNYPQGDYAVTFSPTSSHVIKGATGLE